MYSQIFISHNYSAVTHSESTCDDIKDISRRTAESEFDFEDMKHKKNHIYRED